MAKDNSASDGRDAASSTSRSVAAAEISFSGGSSSPSYGCNPFLSPSYDSADYARKDFSSIFDRDSRSPSETSINKAEAIPIERRLFQANFVLEYQQLYNRYALCLSNLHESLEEVNSLRRENEALHLANVDLVNRLSLLSQAAIRNCLLSDFSHLGIGAPAVPVRSGALVVEPKPPNVRPPLRATEQHRLERSDQELEQVPLPKSISVRSRGYQKLKPSQDGSAAAGQSSRRVNTKPLGESQQQQQTVYIPGAKLEDGSMEFEVYNQGMMKTELCNKWQETGECPYGENCQFAHGVTELRPVIRHPRYKTEVCRMVMAGDNCPYGHRCHFRHSFAEQDRQLPSTLHIR
ncbi:hypothetical protein DM860_015935 [Cuscuta australis]|uniref:C3H1-type domain-containing protein n=1 Tax=Cuscuta australis TaxID=267555 RepID=A0A328E1Z8_9ASTE|nr:hypothetical protein DM860_015935 [Cuscuta australis]